MKKCKTKERFSRDCTWHHLVFHWRTWSHPWCTRVFVHFKGLRSREGEEVQWWLAQRFGCAKGPNGLSKGQLLDEHVDLPLPISYGELMFAIGCGYGVTTHDISISSDPGLHHELFGQGRCLNAIWKSATGDVFFFVGKVITIAMVPWWMRSRRCDSTANAGKRPWHQKSLKKWEVCNFLWTPFNLKTENIFRWQAIHAAPRQTPTRRGDIYRQTYHKPRLHWATDSSACSVCPQCVFTKCPSKCFFYFRLQKPCNNFTALFAPL